MFRDIGFRIFDSIKKLEHFNFKLKLVVTVFGITVTGKKGDSGSPAAGPGLRPGTPCHDSEGPARRRPGAQAQPQADSARGRRAESHWHCRAGPGQPEATGLTEYRAESVLAARARPRLDSDSAETRAVRVTVTPWHRHRGSRCQDSVSAEASLLPASPSQTSSRRRGCHAGHSGSRSRCPPGRAGPVCPQCQPCQLDSELKA